MTSIVTGQDATTGRSEPAKITNNSLHVTQTNLLSFEDEINGVAVVEFQNSAVSAARSTSNVVIGGTGAAGDYLTGVVVTVAPTTAALEIKTGAGVTVLSIPTSATIGQIFEIPGGGCITTTSGFYIALHATGVGTVTAFGRFTA